MGGHASEIIIEVNKDENYLIVSDDGRGIPIDNAKKFKDIFTSLHTDL